MTVSEKLDNFYTSVIDSATAKSISMIDEYKKSLKEIYDEREQAAISKAQNTYRAETDFIFRDKNRKLSHKAHEHRLKVLDRSIELTNQVFNEVEQKLVAFMKTAEYVDYLKRKIIDIKNFAGSDDYSIYINPSDQGLISSLEEELKVNLTLSNRDFFGGIRAVIPSRTILIDHSFLTKLKEAKNKFNMM